MSKRYVVRDIGPNRYGWPIWAVIDTRNDRARATWTIAWAAEGQCDWLNAHADTQPETTTDAVELAW